MTVKQAMAILGVDLAIIAAATHLLWRWYWRRVNVSG